VKIKKKWIRHKKGNGKNCKMKHKAASRKHTVKKHKMDYSMQEVGIIV
jgi:hypothetical protein